MIEQLTTLLSFDPVLIGIFAGLSMMTVQMLKGTFVWVGDNAMVINMGLSIFFATMIILEFTSVLGIAILTFLIMSSASGVYSASKSTKVINLPNYLDEK